MHVLVLILLGAVPRKVVSGDGERGVSAEVEGAEGWRGARQAACQKSRPHCWRHLKKEERKRGRARRKRENERARARRKGRQREGGVRERSRKHRSNAHVQKRRKNVISLFLSHLSLSVSLGFPLVSSFAALSFAVRALPAPTRARTSAPGRACTAQRSAGSAPRRARGPTPP